MRNIYQKLSLLILLIISTLPAQELSRRVISIPDILGYKTLKCDFHTHTVFSDGRVWPTLRIEEAWQDGLDAIAITDHIEYRPHKEYVKGDHNTSYELALPVSKKFGITLIHGAEITRGMPPGHLNALFISDANKLAIDSFRLVIQEVKNQGGLVFWNHPGWVRHQPDGIARWYDEHSWIEGTGILKGIEVVNELNYYPEVHQWCLDKNIAMTGNSDIHIPTSMYFDRNAQSHRTATLVFAKKNSSEAIKEAVEAGRTVVWCGNTFYGKPEYLKAICDSSLHFSTTVFSGTGKEWLETELVNNSDINYELVLSQHIEGFEFPDKLTIRGKEIIRFSFRSSAKVSLDKEVVVQYRVTNMYPEPGKQLLLPVPFQIRLQSGK